jgi:zinc transporter ZupT
MTLEECIPRARVEYSKVTVPQAGEIRCLQVFFLMEQFLAWHHRHSVGANAKQPVTYLILLADGLHNFIGGLAIGASFIVSTEVGVITWIAAAAHEIPQELGDFGILIRGGWGRLQALVANFLSAATILPGALLAYYLSADFNITFLLSFAAGRSVHRCLRLDSRGQARSAVTEQSRALRRLRGWRISDPVDESRVSRLTVSSS